MGRERKGGKPTQVKSRDFSVGKRRKRMNALEREIKADL